jgi:hypothetical protein
VFMGSGFWLRQPRNDNYCYGFLNELM